MLRFINQCQKKAILGLNAFHADSAAIIIDNELSRRRRGAIYRKKHWSGFPLESIKFCLQKSNIEFQDITDVAINSNQFSNLNQKFIIHLKFEFENLSKFIKRNKKKFLIRNILIEILEKKIIINFIGLTTT